MQTEQTAAKVTRTRELRVPRRCALPLLARQARGPAPARPLRACSRVTPAGLGGYRSRLVGWQSFKSFELHQGQRPEDRNDLAKEGPVPFCKGPSRLTLKREQMLKRG